MHMFLLEQHEPGSQAEADRGYVLVGAADEPSARAIVVDMDRSRDWVDGAICHQLTSFSAPERPCVVGDRR